MMRYRRALAIAWLVATGCGGDGGGCRFEDQSIIVTGIAVPEVSDTGCTFPADGDSLLRGVYYVGARTPYLLVPVLANNLVSSTREGSNTGIEDGDLQLASPVEITLHLPSDMRRAIDLPLSFGVPVATVTLEPESLTAIAVEAIPIEHAEAISDAMDPGELAEITVEIVVSATRTANSRGDVGVIHTPPFEFPVTVFNDFIVAGCECDGGQCVAGSESPRTLCGYAQDVFGDPFTCEPEAADGEQQEAESTGVAAESSGTSQ